MIRYLWVFRTRLIEDKMDKPSILIIDDDTDYLEILKLGLRAEFNIVTMGAKSCLNGETQCVYPSLILLDKHLGVYNPEDVINYIRKNDFLKYSPIFLISAGDSAGNLVKEYDLDGFMVKPNTFNDMRKMLYTALKES